MCVRARSSGWREGEWSQLVEKRRLKSARVFACFQLVCVCEREGGESARARAFTCAYVLQGKHFGGGGWGDKVKTTEQPTEQPTDFLFLERKQLVSEIRTGTVVARRPAAAPSCRVLDTVLVLRPASRSL